MTKKLNVAVMFGGRAVEHEISIISALQLIKALDYRKYNIIPVYIDPKGHWYQGEDLLNKKIYKYFHKYKNQLNRVTLLPEPNLPGLCIKKQNEAVNTIVKNNEKFIPVDVFFPAFHGEIGEDGALQGLFEMASVCHTGGNVTTSSCAMNKHICKLMLKSAGIPVLPGFLVDKFDYLNNSKIVDLLESEKGLGYPLFIKPCSRGSSVGIAKAENRQELENALISVFKYDTQALVEPFQAEMFEINIAVLDSDPPRTSVVEIPHSDSGVLSYEDKYMTGGSKKDGTESSGMADLARSINPKDLSQELKDKAKEYALKAFNLLKCNGRFDFMYVEKDKELYFNELNPLPGSLPFISGLSQNSYIQIS